LFPERSRSANGFETVRQPDPELSNRRRLRQRARFGIVVDRGPVGDHRDLIDRQQSVRERGERDR